MDIYLAEPVGPFHTAVGTAFNTFAAKQNVTPAAMVPVIPGGKLNRAGIKLHMRASGEFSTTATPTLALGFWFGTRALTLSGDIGITTAMTCGTATAWPWWMEWDGFLNSTPGTTATLNGQGQAQIGSSLVAFSAEVPLPITQALRTVTIDTTIERAIGVSATWSASSASNSITVNSMRVMILN